MKCKKNMGQDEFWAHAVLEQEIGRKEDPGHIECQMDTEQHVVQWSWRMMGVLVWRRSITVA